MYRIVICDDNEEFLKLFSDWAFKYLRKKKKCASIKTCINCEEVFHAGVENVDIFFLDIELGDGKVNGIELARRIRRKNRSAVIIFVSSYETYAAEGYEVQAYRFLTKENLLKKGEEYFSAALQMLDKRMDKIGLSVGGSRESINIKDILFLEAKGHCAIFHVKNASDNYTVGDSLSELEDKLKDKGFIRVHRSFLVNPMHIKKLSTSTVLFDDNSVISVGRTFYSEAREKFMMWQAQQGLVLEVK